MKTLMRLLFTGFVGIAALFMIASVLNRDSTPAKAAPQATADPDYGLPPAPATPVNEWQPQEPKLPDTNDDGLISEGAFVQAFIAKNRSVNGFSDRQLLYLGQEAWQTVLAMSKSQDSILSMGGADEMVKFTRDWNRMARETHGRLTP